MLVRLHHGAGYPPRSGRAGLRWRCTPQCPLRYRRPGRAKPRPGNGAIYPLPQLRRRRPALPRRHDAHSPCAPSSWAVPSCEGPRVGCRLSAKLAVFPFAWVASINHGRLLEVSRQRTRDRRRRTVAACTLPHPGPLNHHSLVTIRPVRLSDGEPLLYCYRGRNGPSTTA